MKSPGYIYSCVSGTAIPGDPEWEYVARLRVD